MTVDQEKAQLFPAFSWPAAIEKFKVANLTGESIKEITPATGVILGLCYYYGMA